MYLFMLASGAAEPVNILATQLDMPGRSHSSSDNPRTGDVCPADILTGKQVGQELSAPADSPTDSSAYPTPRKFPLQLPGFSSILLARSAGVPAETGIGIQPMSVSVLSHYLCEQSSPASNNLPHVHLAEGAGLFQAIYKY